MIFDTLSEEALQSDYFRSLYMKLSTISADKVFGCYQENKLSEKELSHLLRFSDILSNSSKSDARNIAYKIISLLSTDFSQHPAYKTVSTAVLSKLGNFPAMNYLNYNVALPFDRQL
jgi:POLQ-like helicase